MYLYVCIILYAKGNFEHWGFHVGVSYRISLKVIVAC